MNRPDLSGLERIAARRTVQVAALRCSVAVLALGLAVPSLAQVTPFRSLDGNGIDLVTGELVFTFEEGSIGNGANRLSLLRRSGGQNASQWDGYRLYPDGNYATYGYRTNVWDYAGISSISATRAEELAMHPTVKPVALVADAIRDCSKRGEIVLDGFGGSGSTLIAAEKTGRLARLIEYEPGYCDVIIQRWQQLTGKQATLACDGATFETVEEAREAECKAAKTRAAPPIQSADEHSAQGALA